MTSHDCVAKVRRLLKLKRVGHGGTLDPAAMGVLPIAVGRATRLLQFLRSDKAYRATVRFGVRTTTDDLEGETLAAQAVPGLQLETIKAALPQFLGQIQQIPPSYSAIQVQGQRLYDLARAGQTIEVQARPVEVFKIDVLDWRPGDFPEIDLAIACGPGTYIRAIARDLGDGLGVGGTLAQLIRTESCGFSLTDSLTFEDLEAQVAAGTFTPIDAIAALQHLPLLSLPTELAKRWCYGQRIPVSMPDLPTSDLPATLRIHHEDGRFLGVTQAVLDGEDPILAPQMVFEPEG